MGMSGYSAIAVRLGEGAWWLLAAPGSPGLLDPDDPGFPEVRPGIKGHAVVGAAVGRPDNPRGACVRSQV